MAKSLDVSENSTTHTIERKKGMAHHYSDLPPRSRHQFEKLKSSIILGTGDRRIRSILFLSYNHGEGTTTVATNFAESLAEDKKYKILMVDANTRTPGLQEIVSGYAVDNNLVFSDLLTPDAAQPPLPKPSPQSNLFLVPSGDISYHPSQVFDHTRFEKFISSVTELFDFVIFDSSPIGQYYDSIVLGSRVDGVILVIEAERTQLQEAKWAKQMLQDKNIPILGVVLNRRRFRIPKSVFQKFFR